MRKKERPQSPLEFISAAERIYRRVHEDTKYNFGIKDEESRLDSEGNVIKEGSKRYSENKDFIELTKKQMLEYAELIDFYVQSADSHYPHYMELLIERRTMQDRAIAACRSLKRKYQVNLDILRVPKGKYHQTVELIEHEIAVIQGWRKSDNKWEEKLEKKNKKKLWSRSFFVRLTASNAANLNNNGNLNNNDVTNSNGVSVITTTKRKDLSRKRNGRR